MNSNTGRIRFHFRYRLECNERRELWSRCEWTTGDRATSPVTPKNRRVFHPVHAWYCHIQSPCNSRKRIPQIFPRFSQQELLEKNCLSLIIDTDTQYDDADGIFGKLDSQKSVLLNSHIFHTSGLCMLRGARVSEEQFTKYFLRSKDQVVSACIVISFQNEEGFRHRASYLLPKTEWAQDTGNPTDRRVLPNSTVLWLGQIRRARASRT